MLAATIVAPPFATPSCSARRSLWLSSPGHALALPLMPVLGLDPGIIAAQDGAEKQDCERNAVRRWLATHADRVKGLRPIYLGDDLLARRSVAGAMVAAGRDVLLTAEPASHGPSTTPWTAPS